jgi:UDP-GlcNAc3NAcA epimerase
LFTPTAAARHNLQREGTPPHRIVPVGDVMYDVALQHGARVSGTGGMLATLGLTPAHYVLATIHRAENADTPARLSAIADALEAVSADMPVVWPVHPRTRQALEALNRSIGRPERLWLTPPVGYLEMVRLEKHAAVIATDSGGVQKEAFFHQVPCVTLRDETEWVELIEGGWNRLAPPSAGPEAMVVAIRQAIGTRGVPMSPYGDGDAALRIVRTLADGR